MNIKKLTLLSLGISLLVSNSFLLGMKQEERKKMVERILKAQHKSKITRFLNKLDEQYVPHLQQLIKIKTERIVEEEKAQPKKGTYTLTSLKHYFEQILNTINEIEKETKELKL